MGKLKFTLSNIIFWLSIMATCLLLEDVGFLTSNPKGALGDSFFFMLFALAMGGYLCYFLIEHIKNKVKVDLVLMPVLLACFVCGSMAIWMFHDTSFSGVHDYTYSITPWDQARQMLQLMVYITATYALLFHFTKNHPSIRKIQAIYFVIALIAIASTIFSWINELDNIIYNLSGHQSPKNIYSFFWNPNPFSLMLLFGMFSCFGLNYFRKRIIWYVLIIYFAFMICVVASLTAIIVCFCSLFIYFLVEIIFTIRRHRKRGIFALAVFSTIIVSFVVLFACALNYNMGSFSLFWESIYKYFSLANYTNLSNRTFIWDSTISFLKNDTMYMVFGVGFKNSYPLVGSMLYAYKGITYAPLSTHNGFIQVFLNFGIIGIAAYALFFVYYIYCLFRLLKKDPRFALIFGLIGFALLGHAVMESTMFLNPNSFGLLITAFFYLPMMNKWKHYRHPRLGDDVIEVSKPLPITSSSISKSLAKLFMALIAVTCSFFIFPMFREDPSGMYLLINIIVVLTMCALSVPFIISSIAKNHSRKVATILCVVNFVIVIAPFVYLGLRYFYHPEYYGVGAEWVIPALIVMVLVGEALIFGVAKGQKAKDYLATLVGISKNSIMGLLGVGVIILVSYCILPYLDVEAPLTYIIYPFIVLLAYYLASYILPFKDQKEFVSSYNESLLYSMKMDVLKDRLGDYNEKRRD